LKRRIAICIFLIWTLIKWSEQYILDARNNLYISRAIKKSVIPVNSQIHANVMRPLFVLNFIFEPLFVHVPDIVHFLKFFLSHKKIIKTAMYTLLFVSVYILSVPHLQYQNILLTRVLRKCCKLFFFLYYLYVILIFFVFILKADEWWIIHIASSVMLQNAENVMNKLNIF
jgi:hypothetical protein